MSVQAQDNAPDFTLVNSDKEEVTLSSFKGRKVLLLFFPQSFTGTCIEELCSVRDDLSYYNDIDAEVLAISVDSIFTLDRFKKDQNLNFTLLSDFNKEVIHLYGVVHEEFAFGMKGVAKRSAFVIDKTGVVQYAEIMDVPSDIPNFEEIKKSLEAVH